MLETKMFSSKEVETSLSQHLFFPDSIRKKKKKAVFASRLKASPAGEAEAIQRSGNWNLRWRVLTWGGGWIQEHFRQLEFKQFKQTRTGFVRVGTLSLGGMGYFTLTPAMKTTLPAIPAPQGSSSLTVRPQGRSGWMEKNRRYSVLWIYWSLDS